jgi:membrane fusion protein, multidrug efflux system
MKQLLITGLAAIVILSSCGSSSKDNNAAINDKKAALEKLKGDQAKIEEQIRQLETDLNKLDPANSTAQKAKLVSVETLAPKEFDHYIELQGKIESENISYISPRGGPAQVKQVLVKKGQAVRKGQLLLKLDDAIARQNLAAARQGLETIKTQLAYAKNIYQRQKNLWDQNIGTEVQLITAKNNVATLESQLRSTEENVKVVMEQLNTSNVYSDVNGVADDVNIRVGETFQGVTAQGPQIKIVNNSALKVTGTIPENYLKNVSKGAPVNIIVPDINKTFSSKISFIGSSIDALSRGFIAEAKLSPDPALRPNQIALMKIKDYNASNSVVIPVSTLQNDDKGKFVMVAVNEKGKLLARKRPVNIGFLNADSLEIKTGLKSGDVLITEGFQSLYDGQLITTQ